VAETCRQPNKTDTKTVVFRRTYSLLKSYASDVICDHKLRQFRILGDTHVGKWKVSHSKNFSLLMSGFFGRSNRFLALLT